jgi:hypothetical protein
MLSDPEIGAALRAIHDDVARAWTVEDFGQGCRLVPGRIRQAIHDAGRAAAAGIPHVVAAHHGRAPAAKRGRTAGNDRQASWVCVGVRLRQRVQARVRNRTRPLSLRRQADRWSASRVSTSTRSMRIANVHRASVIPCKSIVSRSWAPTLVRVSTTVLTSHRWSQVQLKG